MTRSPRCRACVGSGGGQRPAQLGVDDGLRPPGLALGELLADAQDRPQARLARPDELAADELVGLAGVAPPLGVADDDPRRQADEHRGAHLAGVRPGGLVVDVLGADGDAGPGERVADRGERHERRADDPDDVRIRGPRGDRGRELAGLRRDGVHLPVGGDDDFGRIAASCQRRASPGHRPVADRWTVAWPAAVRRPRRRGGPAARSARAPAGRPTGASDPLRELGRASTPATRAARRRRGGRHTAARPAGRPRRAPRSPRGCGRPPRPRG